MVGPPAPDIDDPLAFDTDEEIWDGIFIRLGRILGNLWYHQSMRYDYGTELDFQKYRAYWERMNKIINELEELRDEIA